MNEGEAVGLVGANGAGKSTLLELLAGIKSTDGKITLKGLPYIPKNLMELRKKIGYIFQHPDDQVFMPTVYEDIAFGVRNFGHEESFVAKKVEVILERLNITQLREKSVYKLSGGEKRCVAIAGVLVMEPDLILFDEPTTFLDLKGRRNFIRLLNSIHCAKLLATHDLELVLETCTRVLVMDHGRIVSDGNPSKLFTRRAFMEAVNLEVPASLQHGRI